MKSPRDLLLEKHQRTEAKLDAIRQRVLLADSCEESVPAPRSLSFVNLIWEDLFLPSRRWWAVLGAAWCLILAARLPLAGETDVRRVEVRPSAADEAAVSVQWGHLMRADLTWIDSPSPARPAAIAPPRPRGQNSRHIVSV